MAPEHESILSDLLSRWHQWARGYSPVPTQGCAPMFRQHVSPKGWQDSSEIVDECLDATTMEAVDFQVAEMKDPHRSAIYAHARNCYAGRVVWLSPRLPQDPLERARILGEAKGIIIGKLLSAGVM